ncbi:Fic family protein [Candidatus Woesearchaeota archaeon]|nr:Fic family protein [Candidatus Woesearchaeota archaeon]
MNLLVKEIANDLIKINRQFASGVVVNPGSMDFAISAVFNSGDWLEQMAFVVRSLLCDHVFEDGNKRTAAVYVMSVLDDFKYKYDPFRIDQLVLRIAKDNIKDVQNIRRMMENAATKNF